VSQPAEVSMDEAPRATKVPPQLIALIAPDVGMPRVALEGRARWPIAFALLCSLAFAGAQSMRVNAREETLKDAEMSGQLKDMSDRQLDDNAKAAERKFIVKNIAVAAIRPPAICLAYLASLFLLSWFLRGRAKGGQIASVAGALLLPAAIRDLLSAGAALLRSSLPTSGLPLIPTTLTQIAGAMGHPLVGTLGALGNALDFFSLWAALMFSFGLATAASVSRKSALIAGLTAWVLWRLLFACAFHLGG
jgi:hypothetical protein